MKIDLKKTVLTNKKKEIFKVTFLDSKLLYILDSFNLVVLLHVGCLPFKFSYEKNPENNEQVLWSRLYFSENFLSSRCRASKQP